MNAHTKPPSAVAELPLQSTKPTAPPPKPKVTVEVPLKGEGLVPNGDALLNPFADAETLAAVERAGAAPEPQRSSPDADDNEFSWSDKTAIVIAEQRAVACYFNTDGDLVIRQERSWNEDEDTFILIDKTNVDAFLDKLCTVCGILSMGGDRQ